MLTIVFSLMILALAAFPALLFMRNFPQFARAAELNADAHAPSGESTSGISVLIPARNEETSIEQSLQCLSASSFQPLEILVLDDASTDRTAEIVSQFASHDSRVKLLQSPSLPEGWNGKQHACWQLAQAAKFDWLLFLDADVRLSADALPRIAAELKQTPRDLLSGFPCQETGTLFEKLLIPLMHVVLLGFLPLDQMRASRKPEFGAGCGQLFIARREAYFAADGHRAIRNSRHDGLKLPRAFRSANLVTDIFDATDIATCRMYTSMQQVVQGLLKNATEGIAQPKLIAIFTVLLLGGQTLPILSLGHAIFWRWSTTAIVILALATLLSYVPRTLAAVRFRQSLTGVVLNPVAVALFITLQWWAMLRGKLGRKPIAWRGRV
ncbi:MAG: glycosyltransferase family 2 protein [Pirellulaceae bacterium]|nr:glycosyltransferase family 2 protein [Pirellulaceae bacterium]